MPHTFQNMQRQTLAALALLLAAIVGQAQNPFPTSGFMLPNGKTIAISYEVTVNANACTNGALPTDISNQSQVQGSNFVTVSTDDPGIAGASNPTLTPLGGITIGNLVYKDVNKDGDYDSGTDTPIDNVQLRLYLDDGNGVLDAGDGAHIASATTTGGGLYSFNVCPGTYIVEVIPTNFNAGGPLYDNTLMAALLSSPIGGAPDPDGNTTDNDDNGDPVSGFGVATAAFTVAYDVNPANTSIYNHIDFGFKTPTTVTITNVALAEGTSAGPTAFNFTVERSDTDGAFSLTVNTAGGTATSGTDFTAISGGTVDFTAGGSNTATVTVNVTHDNIVEDNETFNVVLSEAPSGVILVDDTGVGTINNDDNATLTLAITGGGASQDEGNTFTFTATLNNPVQGGFQVAYTTNDGTTNPANSPSDYTDNDGNLTFLGNASEPQSWTVNTSNDNTVELNETIRAILGSISMPSAIQTAAISIGGSPQTATLLNNDAATVSIQGNVSELESVTPQTFTITLSNPVDVPVSLTTNTSDGTATTTDSDYGAISNGSVTFAANSTTAQTLTVTITNDNKVEADEVFNLTLSALNATGRNVSFSGGNPTLTTTGTIQNNDAATVTLSVASGPPLQQDEGNTSTTDFVFTATLNNPVQGGLKIAYTTSDGLATIADNDYVDNDATLTFVGTANEPQTITVQVNGDLKVEANESFFVALGAISDAPAGVTANTTPLQGLIRNDELDWGDAPDTYGTLSADNGARHTTSIAAHLGLTIDGDLNGQPTVTANGDDTDTEGDDDDGVTLPAAFITGTTASITVNVTNTLPTNSGFLNAWVDFNNNGNWNDAGEQIFNNVAIAPGNNPLSFAVPSGATPSTTFARFRYTTATVTTPAFTGLQTIGEVEDYQVTIINNQYNISSPTVAEGNAGPTNLTFAVSRTNGTGTGSVDYSIPTGTATSGTDYNAIVAGTINFADTETSKNVIVTVNGDNIVENNETVILTLSNPINGAIATGTGVGTINNDDNATLTFSGGNSESESSSSRTFTATLSAPVQGGFKANYYITDGSATSADDYTGSNGVLTFAGTANEPQSVIVTVTNDNKVELDETFTVSLAPTTSDITMTSPVQASAITVVNFSQTEIIQNDDAAVVSISPVSQSEANTSQVFSISLNNPVDVPVSLTTNTSDGTATTTDSDYGAISNGSVTFTANSTTAQTLTVTINNDNKVEADEVFNLTLSALNASGRNVIFSGNTPTLATTGTIQNDDNATVTLSVIGSASQAEGNSGNTPFTFRATLNNPVQGGFSLLYNTNDGTATAGSDYTDNDNSLSFTGNANEFHDITVNAIGDLNIEADETFTVQLGTITAATTVQTNAISIGGTNPQTATILNDELDWGDAPDSYATSLANNGARHSAALGGLRLGATIDADADGQPNANANATGDGTDEDGITLPPVLVLNTTANLTVNASATGKLDGWVDFNNDGDFADAGEKVFNNVAVVAGNNPLTFAVPSGANPSNTFARFRLSSAGGLPPTGLATDGEVEDYQIQIVNTQFSINDPIVTEGNAGTTNLTFTISRTVNANDCSVNYAITGGTATSGSDYQTFANGTVSFSAGGVPSQTVTVVVTGDQTVELNETVLMTLSMPVNGSILDGDGTGTINNDDAAIITISNPSVAEGSSGTANVTFDINMSNPSDANVVLNYNTVDGSATTADNDYQATSGTHTFSPGQTTKQVTILVNGDCKVEPNETLLLRLSNLINNGRNVTLSGGGATLDGTATIQNTPLPTASITGTTVVCQNAASPNITFTGAAGTAPYTFTYKINNGPDLTVTTSAMSNTVTVSVPTTSAGNFVYTLLSVSDVHCSQNQMELATVTVNPLPTATIAGTTAVCQNASSPSITFTGANATAPYTFTYKINGGPDLTVTSVGNTATVSVPTTSVGSFVYSLVSVKDASSTQCSQNQMGAATVTVNPLPTATIVGATAVCQNASSPSITFTGANATAPYTFTYKINGGPDLTVTSVGNTATVSVPTASAGSFVYSLVSVKDASSTQCSQNQMGAATVTVNPLPTATIVGTIALCQNAPFPQVTFTGNNATAPYTFTYKINGGPDLTVTSLGNTATISQSTATAGVFTYTLVSVKEASSTQCSQNQSGSAVITVHAPPVVSTPQASLCTGLTMILSPTSGGIWQSSNPSIATVSNAGLVTAIMAGSVNFTFTQSSTGCSSTTSNIIIKQTPSSLLKASKYDVCPNEAVTLDAQCSIPTATVNWNPGAPTVTPDAATIPYVYKARCTADGCVGNESSVEVRTHRILVDMKDLDVGALPLPIVRAVKDNMSPTNLIQAPVFPRRWTFIANGCDASESAEFKLSGPVLFNTVDNSGTYAMFANEGNSFYSIDHPNYGNGGSFPNGTYTLTINLYSKDGVGGPFPKNRVPVGILLATRTLEFTVGGQQSAVGGRQSAVGGSEQWAVGNPPSTVDSGLWTEISPNPVSNRMRLQVMDLKGQQVKVNLIDATGRMMLQRSFTPDTNQHQEEFEVSQLSAGMYFLNVNTENKNATIKVVKVE